jgi:hypothetical protein
MLLKPNVVLELRGIKYAAFASEETFCYSATLYLNGRKIAIVSNDGHGGADREHWTNGHGGEDRATVSAHFAAMPPEITDSGLPDGTTFELQPSLETWCHARVADFLIVRDVRKACKRHVVGITSDGKELQFKIAPEHLEMMRAKILAKYPGMVILNGLDDAAIIAAARKSGC